MLKLYVEREALLKSTKLKQELFWTKKTHFANLLFCHDNFVNLLYKCSQIYIIFLPNSINLL